MPPRTKVGVFHLRVFRKVHQSETYIFLMRPVTVLEEITWTRCAIDPQSVPRHRILNLTGFLNHVEGVGDMGASHWVNHLRSFEEFKWVLDINMRAPGN